MGISEQFTIPELFRNSQTESRVPNPILVFPAMHCTWELLKNVIPSKTKEAHTAHFPLEINNFYHFITHTIHFRNIEQQIS